MTPSVPVSSLRAHLLQSLSNLPGSREFHLHLLVSESKKPADSLFPYASTRPKCLEQNIVVLLSEQASSIQGQSVDATNGATDNSLPVLARSFVSAIEASVFSFPATNSTILYVSKVDGTGQGAYPSPTSTLVKAFLEFYASPKSPLYPKYSTHRLWIHIFARSQRQYLFPNSADHPGKKPLGDVALCKWWKRTLTQIAVAASSTPKAQDSFTYSSHLYYLIPGQTELEATYLMRETPSSPSTNWIYSHPYDLHSQMNIPYPAAPHAKQLKIPPINSLIPHFEDDPKTRFLDELATTTDEKTVTVPTPTPKRKRRKLDNGSVENYTTLAKRPAPPEPVEDEELTHKEAPRGPEIVLNPATSSPLRLDTDFPMDRTSTPEPGEAISAPTTPDFSTFRTPTLSPYTPLNIPQNLLSPSGSPTTKAAATPKTPRRLKSDLDTVTPAEFWERMGYRQECCQGAVTGFFVAIFCREAKSPESKESDPTHDGAIAHLSEGVIPNKILERIMNSLLTGVEFSTQERAYKGTQTIEAAIKGLCHGLKTTPSGDKQKGGDEANTDETMNLYSAHVYASLPVANQPLIPKTSAGKGSANAAAPVNVLTVKRKKKKE